MKPGANNEDGLTLVEILVVILIVAVLVALAIPSYHQYLRRGHRADAVRSLLQIAQCQERVRASTGFYDTGRCTDGMDTAHYRFRIEPPDQDESLAFIAVASPIAAQGDDCGELRLDQAGTRGVDGNRERLAACWGGR